jgi:hypothetical protein
MDDTSLFDFIEFYLENYFWLQIEIDFDSEV